MSSRGAQYPLIKERLPFSPCFRSSLSHGTRTPLARHSHGTRTPLSASLYSFQTLTDTQKPRQALCLGFSQFILFFLLQLVYQNCFLVNLFNRNNERNTRQLHIHFWPIDLSYPLFPFFRIHLNTLLS